MPGSSDVSIFWFRRDLRIGTNTLFVKAVYEGPVLPVFIWFPEGEERPLGEASKWWLHHSLQTLDESLRSIGLNLVIREGEILSVLQLLAGETGAQRIYWNEVYEPGQKALDQRIKIDLQKNGVSCVTANSSLLFPPGEIKNSAGTAFQVFTPFWKALKKRALLPSPAPDLSKATSVHRVPQSIPLSRLRLLPSIRWDTGIEEAWKPGELGARNALNMFLASRLASYATGRDTPSIVGTSRLSPYLHFGEIGPWDIWNGIEESLAQPNGILPDTAEIFLKELGWREFAYNLLTYFPDLPRKPLRTKFAKFPWREDRGAFFAWKRGGTGYPIVDAGMRELWTVGWMHNRVRMIVGSFLVKDLLISWQEGEKWFWDTLVDADLASNSMNWQWVSGSGADAAPFFRIFNPVTQGEKFDPAGTYVKRWVPELKDLPVKWIHKPWLAPSGILEKAGVQLGANYPYPIVDHAEARARALEAFETL